MNSQIRLVGFLSKAKAEVLGKVLLGLSIMGLSVLQAYAMARGASAVLTHGDLDQILGFLLLALAAILLKGILSSQNEVYTKKAACKVKSIIRRDLLDKLSCLGPQYQSRKRSGKIQSLITDGVESFEYYLMYYIPQSIITLIGVSLLVIYVMRTDLTVGFLILGAVVVAILGPHLSRGHHQDSTTEYWKAYAVLNSQYIDTMQGMSTLKAFHSSEEKGRELAGNCWDFYHKQIRTTANSLVDSAFVVFCIGMGTSFAVGLAAWHAAKGSVDVVALLSMLFMIPECFKPISALNDFWHSSYLGFSVADQLFEILDEPVPVTEKEDAKTSGLQSGLPEIALEDVCFVYRKDQEDVLKHINMQIRTGQRVAVVGKSGSGKSTIVNALLRFYELESGRILYNGIDIRDFSLSYLRSKISVVFQDTYLFYGTVAENIAMARPDASRLEIEEAARAANIHDFIVSLPPGYETMVGERGANFSGGERQRIAIARAVLKNAPFLILDEATASVDAENEKDIQQALERLMKNKTSLTIAHRLSTVQDADWIYVLQDGVICQQGTHESLLKEDGVYAKLILAQNLKKEEMA